MSVRAYFLTWRTYGTWLHGDPRGSIDDANTLFGRPMRPPHEVAWLVNRTRMAEEPFKLSPPQQHIVRRAIAVVAERRGWLLNELHVGAEHMHVVVQAPDVSPQQAARLFKSWATRALRDGGLLDRRQRVWSKMASTRHLFTPTSHAAAVDYVRRFQ